MAAPLLAAITRTETTTEGRTARIRQLLFRYLLAGLTVSMAVTIGTAPLLLYYFNRLSLIGPAANLLIEGLICFWSLPIGFLASPLIFIAPPAADLLLHLGGYGLTLSLRLATFFNGLPLSTLWLPTPPPGLIVLYYAAILLVLWAISALRGGDARPLVAKTAMAGGGALWLVTLFLFFLPPAELFKGSIPASEITFLDVGQGSSTFLELPTGKRLLIDGGGSESPRFNVGEDIIARFLWQRGIKRLDTIMITHSDADHFNGIPFLLQRFRPQTLWINDFSGHDRNWEKLLELARRLHITVKIPRPGETLITGGSAGIVSLGNPSEPYGNAVNDSSLILRFAQDRNGDLSCLFAGDIGHKAEAQLVKEKIPLQSTFLLSPHHGSSTSNSLAFLQAVRPRTMVVSAGRNRPDNFPTPEVRQRCASLGIPMLITAEHGAITITEKEITWHGTDKDL
jgi:competence protein ComEC